MPGMLVAMRCAVCAERRWWQCYVRQLGLVWELPTLWRAWGLAGVVSHLSLPHKNKKGTAGSSCSSFSILVIAQSFNQFLQSERSSSSSFLHIVAKCRIAGLLEGLVSGSPLSCCLVDHAVLFQVGACCLAWLAWHSSRSSVSRMCKTVCMQGMDAPIGLILRVNPLSAPPDASCRFPGQHRPRQQ